MKEDRENRLKIEKAFSEFFVYYTRSYIVHITYYEVDFLVWNINLTVQLFISGERKPFDMEVFKQLDELVEKEKQDKQKEKQKARKSRGKNVESIDDKSSTSSTTSVRRSKRKTAGSGLYDV